MVLEFLVVAVTSSSRSKKLLLNLESLCLVVYSMYIVLFAYLTWSGEKSVDRSAFNRFLSSAVVQKVFHRVSACLRTTNHTLSLAALAGAPLLARPR